MRELGGKTAFITGGASGIGLALGRACAEAGMQVMLADIEAKALGEAAAGLRDTKARIETVVCDVSVAASVGQAAQATLAAFGKVHLVCNNAGVGGGGPMDGVPLPTWEWVMGVNFMGVVHGIRTFVPHLKAHGDGGHIVNTASMAGMLAVPNLGPYTASKFAVVALSEALAGELASTGIGVTVLCPGWVKTRIAESGRNRPERFGADDRPAAAAGVIAQLVAGGMPPSALAEQVLTAVRENQLYVFTDPQMRAVLAQRFERILAAYPQA
jgi:NAD(P)-dependent dehydrogenase (short-subunit alcohol dehydrogenase family)